MMADKTETKQGGEKPHDKREGGFSGSKSGQAVGKPQDKQTEKPRGRPQQAPIKQVISASGKEVKGIVRIAGRDLRGTVSLVRAIVSVRGIGLNLGKVVSEIAVKELGATPKTMLGELSEEEIEKLEQILTHPENYGVPTRMLNRQKDILTGNDVHYIGSDLAYAVKQDIDHEKDSNTWRGYRHAYGQKVRGQHTRSTGRTGMTVGVLRKAVMAAAGAAAAAQTGAAAQAAGAPGAKAPSGAVPKAGAAAAPKAGAAPAAKAPAAKKEEAKK